MMLYIYLILLVLSSIESCPLKKVGSRSGCYCGIEIDGTNYIQCQPYSIDEVPEFMRSYIYDRLNLSFNSIRHLTNRSFSQIKVRQIYLQENPIESIDKQAFDNHIHNYLEELHIDALKNVTLEFLCHGQWNKLRILELSGFSFHQYDHCLQRLHRLERLTIRRSEMQVVSPYLFQLSSLHELSLMENQIESFNFSASSSNIQLLNLTSNQLQTIPEDLYPRLPQLHTLDLSHNFFEDLPILHQYHSLSINLSSNLINYLQIIDQENTYDLSSNPICTLDGSQLKSNVILHRLTQLHCDCRLAYFLDPHLTNQSKSLVLNQPFGEESKCSTPLIFHGFFLKDLTYEQLLSTCSDELPFQCREVNQFTRIENYAREILGPTTHTPVENTTQIAEVIPQVNHSRPELSSFRLTSFYTSYQTNHLTIFWNFDSSISSEHSTVVQFQIVLEQESSSKTQIIRRSGFISPYLKQYTIDHIPPNKHYYICLLLTRSSYGTDKYCRETRTISTTTALSNLILSKQAVIHMLFTNRSIVFGFLFGTILTTALLLTLAFICHLRSKRQRCRRAASSLFHHHHPQPQQQYLCVDRNDDEGMYSNSIFSSSSSSTKYHHLRKNCRRTCFPPLPADQSWYCRGLTQLPTAPLPPPCCFHHHTPDTTLSSGSTTRRIATLSSQYSTGMDKEPLTSTSIMSATSSEDQTHPSPAKHVYEELTDDINMVRRNPLADVLL